MLRDTVNLAQAPFQIQLQAEIKIAFIPFELYSGGLNYNELEKPEIRRINKEKEAELIRSFLDDGMQLLNVQNNR
jgi:hypothetical protein